MRTLAYLGPMTRVDMRQTVGYALDDDSDKAKKFIFFGKVSEAVNSRRSVDDQKEAARQHREGVQMTDDQALAILTAPQRPDGFADLTDQPTAATAADRQALGQDQIDQRLADLPGAVPTVLGATEYEVATTVDEDEARAKAEAKAAGSKKPAADKA